MSGAPSNSGIWGMLSTGAAVQAAMLISMVAQNLLIPRILGIQNYGMLVGILAPLYFLSGLAEPLFASLLLRYREDVSDTAATNIARALLICAISLPPVILSAVAVGCQNSAIYALSLVDYIEIGAMALLLIVNAVLLAAALATLGGKLLAACYLGQSVTTVCAMPLAVWFGISGVLFVYVSNLAVVAATVLAFGSSPQRLLVAAMRQALGSSARHPFRSSLNAFLAAISPRSAILLLTVVSVLLASAYMDPRELGLYRMSITLLNATLYVMPVSPVLLLEFFSRAETDTNHIRAARNILLAVGCLGVLIATCYASFSGAILGFIFGKPIEVPIALWLVFASVPFFVLISSLSSVLLALRHDAILVRLFLVSSATFIIVFYAISIYAAFFATCISFVSGSAIAMIWDRKVPGDRVACPGE